jgi:glycosyltransferase involved in cell wall biosynthesis
MLPPRLPAAEAVSQEIEVLRRQWGGELVYLNPNEHSPIYIPRLLFGFHTLHSLRRQEARVDLYHLYNPDPVPYPFLRWLRRPVVYSLTGGVSVEPPAKALNALGTVTVYDERSLTRLHDAGVRNAMLVHPGIDLTRFHHHPLPLQGHIRLLMASAPWTPTQFQTKGVDALLAAAQRSSRLHLVFLWRGVLAKEMTKRVQRLGLLDRVTVLDEEVDVNAVLATVHAAIVLAANPAIVKAYPHSLLDALAAGKPVLVSRAIPMADYVTRTGCGQVVESVTPDAILAAVEQLQINYAHCCQVAEAVGRRDFSQTAMLATYEEVYRSARRTQR